MPAQPKSRRRKSPPNPHAQLVALEQLAEEKGPPATSWRDILTRAGIPLIRFPGSRRLWVERAPVEALIKNSRELS